jgi:hypothetical protein
MIELKPLIFEGNNLSLGRILLVSCFLIALITWCLGKDIPTNLFSTISALLVYGLGKKAIDNIGS